MAVSKRVRVPPGDDVAVVGGEDAGDPLGDDRSAHRQPDRVADAKAGALGGPGVDRDLILGRRRPALNHRIAGGRSTGAVVVGADGGPALADHLAVRAGERGEPRDHAGRGGDAGQRAGPVEQTLVEQPAGRLPGVHGPDPHVDVGEALLGTARVRLGDGAGEDQGAGDEGHAEQHGEHRHRQPGLVREHVAQSGPEHAAQSSAGSGTAASCRIALSTVSGRKVFIASNVRVGRESDRTRSTAGTTDFRQVFRFGGAG